MLAIAIARTDVELVPEVIGQYLFNTGYMAKANMPSWEKLHSGLRNYEKRGDSMYSYTFDSKTGGIILNSTPTNFSKEPRPVYAAEMDILGFHKHWDYDKQNEVPYMWAESNIYWYRGVQIAKTKGGDLYTAPELIIVDDANETNPYWKQGTKLIPMDIEAMCALNEDLLTVIEDSTVKKLSRNMRNLKTSLTFSM